MVEQGIFIAIEGVDGSGKTTQFKLLTERLKAVGYDVETFDFPQYDRPSAHFVKQYLNGQYGNALAISPYVASLFYAIDRYEAAPRIRKALQEGKLVLANRYAGSNMAHQGSKFFTPEEQRGFFIWAEALEFEMMGIPRPNLNIFLRVPAKISQNLVGLKEDRSYTKEKHDAHERDLNHLERSLQAYDLLCQLFPKDFVSIECTKNGQLSSITAINNKIWAIIKPLLPGPQNKPRSTVVKLKKSVTASSSLSTEPKGQLKPVDSSKLRYRLENLSLLSLHLLEARGIEVSKIEKKRPLDFYIPSNLSAKVLTQYKRMILKNIDNYHRMHKLLAKGSLKKQETDSKSIDPRLLDASIPLAVLVSADIEAEIAGLTDLVNDLSDSKLEEHINLAHEIKQFLKINKVEIKGSASLSNKIAEATSAKLPSSFSVDSETVQLIEAWPRNELDLVATILYPYTSLSAAEIEKYLSDLEYKEKVRILNDYIKAFATADNNQALALQKVHYRWDIISDWYSLHELIKITQAEAIQYQAISPRYGYEVPSAIEKAGLSDLFIQSFDESLELYSFLQSNKCDAEAKYAVLEGHRVRCQLTFSASSTFSLFAQKLSPELKKVTVGISEQIAQIHPLITEALIAKVNKSSKSSKREKSSKKP